MRYRSENKYTLRVHDVEYYYALYVLPELLYTTIACSPHGRRDGETHPGLYVKCPSATFRPEARKKQLFPAIQWPDLFSLD